MLKISERLVWVGVLLFLGACFGSKREAATASASLPLKTPRTPLGLLYDLSDLVPVTPNDPSYTDEDGSQRVAFDALRAEYAWARQTDCDEFVIGIVDTGLDINHPDFVQSDETLNLENIGTQQTPVYGRNFVDGTTTTNVMDTHGHGTHVAGLIGAAGNNEVGVTGVCWKARLLAARVASGSSGYLSDVIDGLEWVLSRNDDAQWKDDNKKLKVVNISMGLTLVGTTSSQHEYYEDIFSGATALAAKHNVIIVAAAGNEGLDTRKNRTYPANLTSSYVLAVAMNYESDADGSDDSLVTMSNYGGRTVHVSAPGFQILSTLRQGGVSTYGEKTGTSMAAPLVTGTLALMWNHIGMDNISAKELINLFLDNSEPHSGSKEGQPGAVLLTGAKLDMSNALEASHAYANPSP